MKIHQNALACIAIALLCFSCQSENDTFETEESPEIISSESYSYYLDGQAISEEAFIAKHAEYRKITEWKQDPETNEPVVITNGFTTDQKYIDWGIENGHDLAKGLQIEKHLREYAEVNGIIEEYEKTNIVPQSYLDYMDNYLDNIQGTNEKAQERTYNHLCDGGTRCSYFPFIHMVAILPAMPNGWNNRISRVWCSGIISHLWVYNRTFFRDHIWTLAISGFADEICWEGSNPSPIDLILNNRMSSCISN